MVLATYMLIVLLHVLDNFDFVLQSIGILSVQGFSVQEIPSQLHGSCSSSVDLYAFRPRGKGRGPIDRLNSEH